MTKKGGTRKLPPNVPHTLSMLETGKQLTSGTQNPKLLLKLELLQKIATWASSEASIPSLAAFFGHQFATAAEASGAPLDHSLFSCQRCETILQPGLNCTVRIQKTQGKTRHRYKKQNFLSKNVVVYKCHFCSHKNQKRGTPKGHMKEICPPKVRPSTKTDASISMLQKCGGLEKGVISKDERIKIDEISSTSISAVAPIIRCPETPVTPLTGITLLDQMKRKRNKSRNKSGPNRSEEYENKSADAASTASASRKRRRKQWTSLKYIAESNERQKSQNIINLTTPLFL